MKHFLFIASRGSGISTFRLIQLFGFNISYINFNQQTERNYLHYSFQFEWINFYLPYALFHLNLIVKSDDEGHSLPGWSDITKI